MRPTQPVESDPASVLETIADAGVALLCSGAEVSRVEDTMERLARAYQLGSIEAAVLPTALFVSSPDGRTIMRRIRKRMVNLAVLEAVNQVSRDVARAPVPVGQLQMRLQRATDTIRYPVWALPLFAAAGAAMISQLMEGTRLGMVPAAIAGALTQMVYRALRNTGLPGSLADLLSAVVAPIPALIAAFWGLKDPGAVFVGGVMILTPGLLMTTAVRDGIAGDLLAAAGRLLEALLSAAAIAGGASFSLYIYLSLGGRWP